MKGNRFSSREQRAVHNRNFKIIINEITGCSRRWNDKRLPESPPAEGRAETRALRKCHFFSNCVKPQEWGQNDSKITWKVSQVRTIVEKSRTRSKYLRSFKSLEKLQVVAKAKSRPLLEMKIVGKLVFPYKYLSTKWSQNTWENSPMGDKKGKIKEKDCGKIWWLNSQSMRIFPKFISISLFN